MAIVVNVKSSKDLLASTKQTVIQRTGLNYFDSDSKTRALVSAVVEEQLQLNRELSSVVDNLQLETVEGDALLAFGASRGVEPLNTTFAQVSSSELNLAFITSTGGTFGSINGAANITIPIGTIVYTEPNGNEAGALIEYLTTENIVCDAADTFAYFSARAKLNGSIANVGAGVLTRHNFTNYTDVGNNSLRVINFHPILNGRDQEQSSNYKFRIAQKYNTLLQNSDVKIKLSGIKVPGALDIKPIPGLFGIGTVGVVVLSSDFESNTELIQAVQSRLDKFQGVSGYMVAVPASRVGFHIEIKAKALKDLSLIEGNIIKIDLQKIISDYFRSVGLGGTVRLDEMLELIKARYRGTIAFTNLTKNFFKNVSFSKGFATSSASQKEYLTKDSFVLEQDEFAALVEFDLNLENLSDV